MTEPVSAIPNLGPASVVAYARASIRDADTLRQLGADDAYSRLLAAGERPHFIGYYALVMGLQGRPWNDCKGAEKAALRQRFDTLVAANADRPGADGFPNSLMAALNELGIVDRAP